MDKNNKLSSLFGYDIVCAVFFILAEAYLIFFTLEFGVEMIIEKSNAFESGVDTVIVGIAVSVAAAVVVSIILITAFVSLILTALSLIFAIRVGSLITKCARERKAKSIKIYRTVSLVFNILITVNIIVWVIEFKLLLLPSLILALIGDGIYAALLILERKRLSQG